MKKSNQTIFNEPAMIDFVPRITINDWLGLQWLDFQEHYAYTSEMKNVSEERER